MTCFSTCKCAIMDDGRGVEVLVLNSCPDLNLFYLYYLYNCLILCLILLVFVCQFFKALFCIKATCAKTLVWSFLLCFLVMTVWSMLMVEMVHPLLQELRDRGSFMDCKGCDRAMSSVTWTSGKRHNMALWRWLNVINISCWSMLQRMISNQCQGRQMLSWMSTAQNLCSI